MNGDEPMRSDCHVHVRGDCEARKVLAEMDRLKIDKVGLMGRGGAGTIAEQRVRDDELSKLCSADRKRLLGFARIDPRLEGITDEIRRCRQDLKLPGVKMLPDHWSPCDEFLWPVYQTIEAMGMPILFHSGILWGNADSSRFCRPVLYESVIHFPRLKIALAHIGWPWTDECIAVADRFKTMARMKDGRDPELKKDVVWRNRNLHERTFEVDVQCKVDLTPGTPDVYRAEVLRRCYDVLGADMLVFGTDSGGADDLTGVKTQQERDERIFRDDLGLSDSDIDRIMGSNVLKLLGKA